MDLIDNTVILNGYNERSGYNRDLSSLELEARRIIHGEFKINFEEQIRIGGRYLVDGLIPLEKNPVVLEFDGWRHGIEEQKERDQKKDATLSLYKYSVVRIPEKTIKDDKSSLRTSMLDALYGVKCPTKKKVVPMNQAATLTSTEG